MPNLFLRAPRKVSLRPKKVFIFLLTLSLVWLLLFSYFNARLAPVLATLGEEAARAAAIFAVDSALSDLLSQTEEDLVSFRYDAQGRLSLLTCDTAMANRLRTAASEAVNRALAEQDTAPLSVPLGSLFRSPLFAGRGPRFTVRVVPLSRAVVTLSDSFTSAGINQTLFSLSCDITVEINTVTPTKQKTSTLFFSCPITQLVIAGDVPQIYVGAEE